MSRSLSNKYIIVTPYNCVYYYSQFHYYQAPYVIYKSEYRDCYYKEC